MNYRLEHAIQTKSAREMKNNEKSCDAINYLKKII